MCQHIIPTSKYPSPEDYYTVEQQMALLADRKLCIEDTTFAKHILEENSYTSFIKYYGPRFLVDPAKHNSDYLPGATLSEIYSLYTFNRKLSALYLEYILVVERRLKTVIADHFASIYKPTGYWFPDAYSEQALETIEPPDPKTRFSNLIADIEKAITKKCANPQNIKNTPFEKYNDTDKRKEIPIWLLVNILSLGTVRRLFNCLKQEDKAAISSRFNLSTSSMEHAFALLNTFRNSCAHDERIFDFYSPRAFKVITNGNTQTYYGVYAITRILKHLLSAEHFILFYKRLHECFAELQYSVHTISIGDIQKAMRFPPNEDLMIAELGRYNDDVVLSAVEFRDIVTRYILPLIPMAKLEQVKDKENSSIGQKRKSKLVDYSEDENRFYFSQSNTADYTLRTEPLATPPLPTVITTVQTHLQELISNLQIVWNTKKASALKLREQKLLFSTNTEIAYQLSICSLLANQVTPMQLVALSDHKNSIENELQAQRALPKLTKDAKRQPAKIEEEKVASMAVLERKQRETLYCILSRMDQWAQKTYEGKHMPFGVIVNRKLPTSSTFDYITFLGQNYSATISDGLFSCVEVYADGSFDRHIPSNSLQNNLYTIPYPHKGFAQECCNGKVGILLTTEGDIIIISDQKMIYSKHNGRWTHNQFDLATCVLVEHLSAISENSRMDAAQSILSTLIDVSYSHGGACLAIAEKNPPDPDLLRMTYPMLLDKEDRLIVESAVSMSAAKALQPNEKETDSFRITVLRHLIGQNRIFHALNAYLRRELLEMDGSLILGSDGLIHAVASIVNTNGASVMSGARTTAAIRLSMFGLAIKVSQDGYMTFYKQGKEILTI